MVADVMPITGSAARAAARLCNFFTGHAILLQPHIAWLDNTVAPLVRAVPNSWVDIIGYASHLGHRAFNLRLSFNRCESVRKQILTYGTPVTFPQEWGKGDSESTGAADNNDGYWRAVDVYVYGKLPAPPPRPQPPSPPSVPSSTKFRIRVFRAAGASIVIVQGDAVVFQIVDGVSIGSHSLGGQAYIGPSSPRLRAMPGVNKTVLDPQVIPVSTGKGFGLGLGSASTGELSAPIIFKPGECCGAPGGVCSRFK
jgi:hypothetical protein